MTIAKRICKQCDAEGSGNYCNNCGQSFTTRRLTVSGIVHEIFHFFSHLDKGFLFTLKRLIIAPGQMQSDYVEGHRAKYQKPFSMFFLCATIAALIYYWTNLILLNYFNAGNANEVSILRQYMVILQVVMLPVYAAITYVVFIRSKYNYAELFVLLLYSLSFLLIVSSFMQFLKLIWTTLEIRYIELPIIVLYNLITNRSFFKGESKLSIVLRTILASALCFLLAGLVQDYLIKFLS